MQGLWGSFSYSQLTNKKSEAQESKKICLSSVLEKIIFLFISPVLSHYAMVMSMIKALENTNFFQILNSPTVFDRRCSLCLWFYPVHQNSY